MNNRKSRFHITINPNRGGNLDVLQVAAMLEWLREYDQVWQWLQAPDGNARRPLTRDQRRQVGFVRERVGIEDDGDYNGSVHAHILMEISHRTHVAINTGALRRLVDQYLRANSSIKVQFLATDADVDRVQEYLSKSIEWHELTPH